MIWEAIGALALFTGALAYGSRALWVNGHRHGYQQHQLDMADRRAQRRAEARATAATGRHALAPFPDEAEFERLASTGELTAMAEAGEIGRLKDETAAFFRILALRGWVARKGAHAG